MVNGLLFAAAARIPICMLSQDMTDEDRAGCCLLARLIPKRSCDFSSLHPKNFYQHVDRKDEHPIGGIFLFLKSFIYLMKRTESPANNLFVLTKTLQPVVSRCLFACPKIKATCRFNV